LGNSREYGLEHYPPFIFIVESQPTTSRFILVYGVEEVVDVVAGSPVFTEIGIRMDWRPTSSGMAGNHS
jgi:hypothetical protein